MGKKRRRVPGPVGQQAHTQTLGDEVKQVRDLEFAAERKHAERVKRQKLAAEKELEDAKKEVRGLRAKLRNTRGAEQRAQVQKQVRAAVARRRELQGAADTTTQDDSSDDENDPDMEDARMDESMRLKIQNEAQVQQDEVSAELSTPATSTTAQVKTILQDVGTAKSERAESDEEDEDADDDHPANEADGDVEREGEAELSFLEAAQVTEEDELALAMFEGDGVEGEGMPRGRTLGDIIMEKLREQEEAMAKAAADAANPERAAREKKIADTYSLVGQILSRYRAGKIPKAFKIIPKLPNWEELVFYTRPDSWSAPATFQATRIFVFNLKSREVERFLQDVLVPKCMDDIDENKKLNYHYYQALIRAAYKPEAFNKGVLFPLCEARACSMRQATVFGSVLAKISMPVLHSAAALLFICGQPWSPTNCVFVTTLLNKGYALPYKVIDAVVEYFVKTRTETRALPLAWHRSLLVFAQRYKMELQAEQKDKLKLLMRIHTHPLVTTEIRRELFSARNRGDQMDPDANTIAMAIANAA